MSDSNEITLEAVERTLRSAQVRVPTGAKARVARQLEQDLQRGLLERVTWPAALASVAAAALVLLYARPGPAPAPRPQRIARAQVSGPSPKTYAGPSVDPGPTAELERVELPAAPPTLRLWRGEVALDGLNVSPADPVELHTRQARLRFVGARLEVTASETETRLLVKEGTVWVSTGAGRAPVAIEAGRSIRVGPPAKPVLKPELQIHRAPEEAPLLRAPRRPRADRAPAPPRGAAVEALLELADTRRREGDLEAAVEAYAEVLRHPARGDYEEEASYLIASALDRLGRGADAERHLAAAARAHPDGLLAPERAALWARLRLDAKDPAGAAEVLEASTGHGWSRILDERRLEVAEALAGRDPARARRLLELVARTSEAQDLARRARRALQTAKKD